MATPSYGREALKRTFLALIPKKTPFMTKYKFSDVVLVVFSQPDGSKKQRPALVVLDIGDDDVVLAPITSKQRKGKGDLGVNNFHGAGLIADSWIRLAKLACLNKKDIARRLGKLASIDKKSVISSWKELYKF